MNNSIPLYGLDADGYTILDACRSDRYNNVLSVTAARDAGAEWTPPASGMPKRPCICCDDCPPGGAWPGDPLDLAPWWLADEPESHEIWYIRPIGIERLHDIVQLNDNGSPECANGSWLIKIDINATPRGLRWALTWLAAKLHTACDKSNCAHDSCSKRDIRLKLDCDKWFTLRNAQISVLRTVPDDTPTICLTRVEIVLDGDPRLYEDVEWIEQFDPVDFPAPSCNPSHPLWGGGCDCPDPDANDYPCTDILTTPWPDDPASVGCTITAGDGEDSPLTRVTRLPDASAQWDLTEAVPGLTAPLAISVAAAPTGGNISIGAKSIVWNGFTAPGAYRVALTISDVDNTICRVALGVVVLPCCDDVKHIGPNTIPNPPETPFANSENCTPADPPNYNCITAPTVWLTTSWFGGDCIKRGEQVGAGWLVHLNLYNVSGPNLDGAELRIPVPPGVASWNWLILTPSGDASYGGPTSGSGSTEIIIPNIHLGASPLGVIDINIWPTHDGSTSDMGDLTATLYPGSGVPPNRLDSPVEHTAPGPPLCACQATPCGCKDIADVRHGTISSIGASTVVWSAGSPIDNITPASFGAVGTVGSDIVWTVPDGVSAESGWSDAITVTTADGCSTVLVHHHTFTAAAAAALPCDAIIAPPTPIDPVCDITPPTAWCDPLFASVICYNLPEDIIGYEPVISITAMGAGKIGVEVRDTPPACRDRHCPPTKVWGTTTTFGQNIQLQPGLSIVGGCPDDSTDILSDISCADKCICFVVPKGDPFPIIRIGRRRWVV